HMNLEHIFFARYVELGPDGLFTVVGGGLNRINAGELPWSWGILFLLTGLRLTTEEAQGEHTVAIYRETPGGQLDRLTEGPLAPLTPNADVGPDGRVGLIYALCLVSQHFAEAGVYKYQVKIDGQVLGVAELLLAGPAQGEQDR